MQESLDSSLRSRVSSKLDLVPDELERDFQENLQRKILDNGEKDELWPQQNWLGLKSDEEGISLRITSEALLNRENPFDRLGNSRNSIENLSAALSPSILNLRITSVSMRLVFFLRELPLAASSAVRAISR